MSDDCYHCGGQTMHYPNCMIVPDLRRGLPMRVVVLYGYDESDSYVERFADRMQRMGVELGLKVDVGPAEVREDPITYDPSDGSVKGVRG